jgi:hypothetical protein
MEAGACKIPKVSTTLGAEGLSVENGKHILIEDTPESPSRYKIHAEDAVHKERTRES